MITDAFNTLTKALSNVSANTTVYFDDAIDLLHSRNIGEGHPVYAVVTVTAAMVGGSATASVAIGQNTTQAGQAGGETFLGSAFFNATSPVGTVAVIPVLPAVGNELSGGKRYIHAKVTISGGTLTSATFTVTLVPHVADGKIEYPSGFVS
jgi:hypothetical protein